MNARNPLLWTCILAAGSTGAQADIFSWLAGNGSWEDHAMWNGPVGQYPDSILDVATISGNTNSATLNQNLAVGTLNILNGSAVYSNSNSVFVNADTQLTGSGSSLSVTQSPSLRDFDTDTLTISTGILAMYNGLAQFDEALIITNSGGVLGTGTLEMNSTTGNIDLSSGAIWAMGGPSIGTTLLITRTDASTSRLDWTSPNGSLIVWDGKTMINELPYAGSLGGRIRVSGYQGDAAFESVNGFIASASSELAFSGDSLVDTASIVAPFIDSYGLVQVADGRGLIDSPITALRGDIDIYNGGVLGINATLLTFDSINIVGNNEDDTVQLTASVPSTVNFTGGASSIVMGVGSRFDLDGLGENTVNIANGSSLWLEAEFLDYATSSPFNTTLNIDGSMHVEPVNGQNTWTNAGEINLDSGELTGRGIINNGVIRGTGSVDGTVTNNGEIIADGGTLEFGFVNMDGNGAPEVGILRAQTGDLVLNMQANGSTHQFSGTIFVGDGIGVRETFNADVNLVIADINGAQSSLRLNSGFVVLDDFQSNGDVVVEGQSLIRATGPNNADGITFSTGSTTTINGTLEVDGVTWFVPGATVLGSGIVDAVSTIKGIYFQNGADLGDVSLHASGNIVLSDVAESVASVHSLVMRDTASLLLGMYESQGSIITSKLIVEDQAILNGVLEISNYPQTGLPTGQSVTILEAASIDGDFESIDFSGLGPNRRAFVTITDTTVEVFVTCSADLNADGGTDFFDVSMFMAQFNSNDLAADLDDDGDLDFFDVSIFLSAYDAGC